MFGIGTASSEWVKQAAQNLKMMGIPSHALELFGFLTAVFIVAIFIDATAYLWFSNFPPVWMEISRAGFVAAGGTWAVLLFTGLTNQKLLLWLIPLLYLTMGIVRILVAMEDRGQERDLLQKGFWRCPSCKGWNEPPFVACGRCNAKRPG